MHELALRAPRRTGAGRGIGRATALELARLGAAVAVNDLGTSVEGAGTMRDRSRGRRARSRRPAAAAMAIAASVTDFAGVERMWPTRSTASAPSTSS